MNSLAFLPSGKLKQHFATLILYVYFTKRKEVGKYKKKAEIGSWEIGNSIYQYDNYQLICLSGSGTRRPHIGIVNIISSNYRLLRSLNLTIWFSSLSV